MRPTLPFAVVLLAALPGRAPCSQDVFTAKVRPLLARYCFKCHGPDERARKARHSILDDVPPGLPAMTRAVKLTRRAARVGFDWPSTDEVMAKPREELEELQHEIDVNDLPKARAELGDLLFVAANLARKLDVDPEDALRACNAKFERRFHHIEKALAERGKTPDQSDLEEMDGLWNDAKALESYDKAGIQSALLAIPDESRDEILRYLDKIAPLAKPYSA